MAPKDRSRIEAEKAAQLLIELEKERQYLIQKEIERLEKEKLNLEQKIKCEENEQKIREIQLNKTELLVKKMIKFNWLFDIKEKNNNEWEKYLSCDNLPNVFDCKDLNMYMYLWKKTLEHTNIDELTERTQIVLYILNKLYFYLENQLDFNQNQISNFKTIINDYECKLRQNFDVVSYNILLNIETNMEMIDLDVMRYSKKTDNFKLCLWTLIQKPTPQKNPRINVLNRISIKFEEQNLDILFPESLQESNIVVKVLWLNFDHYSQKCLSFQHVLCPKEFDLSLNNFMKYEYEYKRKLYKKLPILIEKIDKIKIAKEFQNFVLSSETTTKLIENEQQTLKPKIKTVEEIIDENLKNKKDQILKQMVIFVGANEINLRKYIIVGGVLDVNLFYQPSQPKILLSKRYIRCYQLPKELKIIPFYICYIPPAPPEANVRRPPEQIEAEIKQQEIEYNKLILVNIVLPETVLFFEQPLICYWNEKGTKWKTDDIHDIKYNEDKFTMTFRTGRLGIFGIAVNKFINFPFQTWELKPEPNGGGIIFSLTAAIIIVEFLVKDDKICLTQLQNGPTNALLDKIGQFYHLTEIKNVLRLGGINVFPSFDIFCYVEGACEKLWPLEKHVYYCMAFLSNLYNFTWSRWNNVISHRTIIMQCREILEKKKQKNYSTVMITPERAIFIDSTEVSQTLNTKNLHEKEFYSDLYHLIEGRGGTILKKKLENQNLRTINTVANLLISIRMLSFA